jgi:hypothetical protein
MYAQKPVGGPKVHTRASPSLSAKIMNGHPSLASCTFRKFLHFLHKIQNPNAWMDYDMIYSKIYPYYFTRLSYKFYFIKSNYFTVKS